MILATCGGYLGASSALILLNKFLLSNDGFSFPLLLSGSGMVMTFLGSSLMVRVPALVPERQVWHRHWPVRNACVCAALAAAPSTCLCRACMRAACWQRMLAFAMPAPDAAQGSTLRSRTCVRSCPCTPSCPVSPAPRNRAASHRLPVATANRVCAQVVSQRDYLQRILPLGFCSAATLALGNVAYLYLDVGLLQMLKACCPLFVMLVAICFRLERLTAPLVASITFIAAGTAATATSGAPAPRCTSLRARFHAWPGAALVGRCGPPLMYGWSRSNAAAAQAGHVRTIAWWGNIPSLSTIEGAAYMDAHACSEAG